MMIFQTSAINRPSSAITVCSFYPCKYMSLTFDEQCTDMVFSLEASCDYPSYVLKTFCVCVCARSDIPMAQFNSESV
jgi:hypothetical protein